MRMKAFKCIALLLLSAIMLTGCLDSYCDYDYECAGGEYCDGVFCKPVEKKVKKCQEMTDCPSGEVCKNGRCK